VPGLPYGAPHHVGTTWVPYTPRRARMSCRGHHMGALTLSAPHGCPCMFGFGWFDILTTNHRGGRGALEADIYLTSYVERPPASLLTPRSIEKPATLDFVYKVEAA